MKLKYNINTTLEKYLSKVSYKLEVPRFIVELIQKSQASGFTTIENYIDEYIGSGTQLHNITLQAFGFMKFILSKDVKGDEVKLILENGYIEETRDIEFELNSFEPLVNLYKMFLNDTSIELFDKSNINKRLIKLVSQTKEGAFDIRVISTSLQEQENEMLDVTLDLENDGTFKYEGMLVNESSIDWQLIWSLNNLVDLEFKSIKTLGNYKKLTIDVYNKFSSWQRISDDEFYEIKQNSIEYVEFASFIGIPVFDKGNSILKSNFTPDSKIYKSIIEEYLSKGIKLNAFIKNAFIKESDAFIKKFLSSPNLQKELKDPDVFRNLLLSKSKFIIDTSVDIEIVAKLIQKATVENVGVIVSKLNGNAKDKILDYRIIKRIAENNVEQLSKKQLEILEDEEKKLQAIKDEYISTLGQITHLGMREKLRDLTKAQKKTYKIDKNIKKWLDSNIGHSKGNDQEITIEMLNKAKNILSKAKKIAELKK